MSPTTRWPIPPTQRTRVSPPPFSVNSGSSLGRRRRMANKTFKYWLKFTFKAQGNRATPFVHRVEATTVPRAISKLAKDIDEGKWEALDAANIIPEEYNDGESIRASDLLVVEASRTDPAQLP